VKKVVLLRHGESLWNKENLFTGWTDVELSEKGMQEAIENGCTMRSERWAFDIIYTSRRIPP
jgi:2,3-bisphosphoglycerate-dependent phosphoglycerate mutase